MWVTLAVKNIQIRASFHICLIRSLNAQAREKNLALCSEDYYYRAAFVEARKEQSQKMDSTEDHNQVVHSASALLINHERTFVPNLAATQQLRINTPDSWFPNTLAQ